MNKTSQGHLGMWAWAMLTLAARLTTTNVVPYATHIAYIRRDNIEDFTVVHLLPKSHVFILLVTTNFDMKL